MTNSKLYTKFCSSVINACHSLFVWSSQDGQNKFGRSGSSLCSIIIFPTHVYTQTMKMITKMRNWKPCLNWDNLKMQ